MLVDLQADPLKTQVFLDQFSLFFIHFGVKGAESCSSWCKNLWLVAVGAVVGEVSFALAMVASGVVHVSSVSTASGSVYIHSIGVSWWGGCGCRVSVGWGRISVVCVCGRWGSCLLFVVSWFIVLFAGSFLVSVYNSPLSVQLCGSVDPVL